MGPLFLREVRQKFAPLFRAHGFAEVGSEDTLSYALLTAMNSTQYIRLSCDFRDRFIDISLGWLSEGVVPPIPIAPPRKPSDVREIPGPIIVWLATGDKDRAFAMFEYRSERSLEDTISALAQTLEKYGARLFAGDPIEWKRAAELTTSRQLSQ